MFQAQDFHINEDCPTSYQDVTSPMVSEHAVVFWASMIGSCMYHLFMKYAYQQQDECTADVDEIPETPTALIEEAFNDFDNAERALRSLLLLKNEPENKEEASHVVKDIVEEIKGPMQQTTQPIEELSFATTKLNIQALKVIEDNLKIYALAGHERMKLATMIQQITEYAAILEAHKLNTKELTLTECTEIQAKCKQMQKDLNAIAFEGKGVRADDKHVSAFNAMLIWLVQAVRAVLDCVTWLITFGHVSGRNHISEALIGRSFFIQVPATPRELHEIQTNKEEVHVALDEVLNEVQSITATVSG